MAIIESHDLVLVSYSNVSRVLVCALVSECDPVVVARLWACRLVAAIEPSSRPVFPRLTSSPYQQRAVLAPFRSVYKSHQTAPRL